MLISGIIGHIFTGETHASFLTTLLLWLCRSTRFVIGDTVEERILQLQEKKHLVFEG